MGTTPTTPTRTGALRRLAARAGDVAYASARPSAWGSVGREVLAASAALALYPVGVANVPVAKVIEFASRALPAAVPTRRPVVLVHGYGSTKSHLIGIGRRLAHQGHPVFALNYNAWTADIAGVAGALVAKVDEVLAETGADKVHLVGHSMGGLVSRVAVEQHGLGDRVDVAVTVGTPHGGSDLATLAASTIRLPFMRSAAQMRPGSGFLTRLEAAAARNARSGAHDVSWVALYSNADMVVAGRAARLRTPGAENICVTDEGHVGMLLSEQVIATVADRIDALESASARTAA